MTNPFGNNVWFGTGGTNGPNILGPSVFLTFVLTVLLVTVAIGNNPTLRSHLHTIFGPIIPDLKFRIATFADAGGFSDITECIKTNVIHELTEGLVGVYSMQGRRGNMEDRFSILQDVHVGSDKKMSFFGVFDGHGGQFAAEYLRSNLFKNTVNKIKELRSGPTVKSRDSEGSKPPTSVQRKDSSRKTPCEIKVSESVVEPPVAEHQKPVKSPALVRKSLGDSEHFLKPNPETKANAETCSESEEPLKKDDVYNSINIRKKSIASLSANDLGTAKKEKIENENDDYVDLNENINYTKLLTDQLLDLDSKVVDQCKTKTDLSGSTAVVAVLDGELLVVGNVGDSRAVMADEHGRAVPLSFDHKPNQLKERRRIKEAGGFITFSGVWRVAGILATSRAVGDFPLKHPRPLVTAEPDVLTFSLSDHKVTWSSASLTIN
ncbi:PPM-type phosphatase domain [Trinorchestia longiramus]|nr:PPM-type phosphatase domain [Trinorchestia longiramus]